MQSIYYKDLEVTLHHKPHLKHSYIQILPEGKVVIKTPYKSQHFAYELLEKKELWVRKHLQKLEQNTQTSIILQKEVLLFGEVVSISHPSVEPLHSQLQKLPPDTQDEKVVACYNHFYKTVAKKYITQRVVYFAQKMQLHYNDIKYRKMKRRWGSCNSKGVLTFNTQLIKVKKELIDYVVVHELAHLIHMNHSKQFHALVAFYLPDAYHLRKELHNTQLLLL